MCMYFVVPFAAKKICALQKFQLKKFKKQKAVIETTKLFLNLNVIIPIFYTTNYLTIIKPLHMQKHSNLFYYPVYLRTILILLN